MCFVSNQVKGTQKNEINEYMNKVFTTFGINLLNNHLACIACIYKNCTD